MPPKLTTVNFYSKNPALAQREYSEVVEHSASPAKFRMTSHNVMNPNNKPDEFEQRALAAIRDKHLKEYHELTPGGFRYARTLIHKASCIACHGSAEAAPIDVKVRYGTQNGFGFKEGDVAGIISVRLPAQSFADVAFNVVGLWPLVMILAGFVIAMLYMRFAVVGRVRELTLATRRISLGKEADLAVASVESEEPQRARPARARHRAAARVDQHGDPAAEARAAQVAARRSLRARGIASRARERARRVN